MSATKHEHLTAFINMPLMIYGYNVGQFFSPGHRISRLHVVNEWAPHIVAKVASHMVKTTASTGNLHKRPNQWAIVVHSMAEADRVFWERRWICCSIQIIQVVDALWLMSQLCMVLIITPIHQLERFGEKNLPWMWVRNFFGGVVHSTGCYTQWVWSIHFVGQLSLKGVASFPRGYG